MKIGEFTRQGGSMSAEHQQQSATPRHLSKGSIIFIIVTLVTFLVISLISLAVLSTLFVWKKTNTETGFHNPRIHITTNVQQESTAQTTLDPTHHCQEDAPEPKSCEDGWFFSNRSCYWYNPEELTWNDAEAACRLQTATLAEITSEEEWNFVTTFNIRHPERTPTGSKANQERTQTGLKSEPRERTPISEADPLRRPGVCFT
ncbi:uncharacterized protein LOC144624683 [Crassostrea virginica]